jgi:carbamoyltransferase
VAVQDYGSVVILVSGQGLVLGINLGRTHYGKRLYDGGACIANEDGILVAIAEERVARVKHCGGYSQSANYCLSSIGADYRDLDLICTSSCVEPLRQIDESLGLPEEVWGKTRIVPHHLSHAYSAYALSPFTEALIVVLDGGGNILEAMHNQRWWEHKREQNTYYVASGAQITLLERQFDQPYDVGYGEAYRCFTEYLGFESDANASKVMSLVAYAGENGRWKNLQLFYYEGEKLKSALRNYPPRVVTMLQGWAAENNLRIPTQRMPSEAVQVEHMELAGYIQGELERSLIEEIQRLHKKTGLTNLCLAGGVALNCVLNEKILSQTPIKRLFVQPAAGDTGQPIGNALWGVSQLRGGSTSRVTQPYLYLGKEYDLSDETIAGLSHADYFDIQEAEDIASLAAHLISEGQLIGWFQGRSEFGPRALGNRSILADPRYSGVAKRLARCKGRESFRPFAPSVLAEAVGDVFEILDTNYSYMAVTASVKDEYKPYIENAYHVDGSSRLQIVDELGNPKFHNLIERYYEITGIPLILNTSFNKSGEPIVETPLDAVKAFRQMELDFLIIGDLVLSKKERMDQVNRPVVEPLAEITLAQGSANDIMGQIVERFPDRNISLRSTFGLDFGYWEWILKQRKLTTIRYRENAIDIPISTAIPVLLSKQGLHPGRVLGNYQVGTVDIGKITIKHFGDLDDRDGKRDGFSDVAELCIALQKYYGPISAHELVTIYEITPSCT